jgi:DNA-binding response OmpR family regulator
MILLVEDDISLSELLIEYLEGNGFEMDYARDGRKAIELIKNNYYQLIILDLNLPEIDGIEVCKQMCKNGTQSPCLMLTARTSLDDKIAGFEAGADDYLLKPFAMPELMARINSLTKRSMRQTDETVIIGDLIINWKAKEAFRGDIKLKLSPTDWNLLSLLSKYSPNMIRKEVIVSELWKGNLPSKDALKMVIYRFRKAIEIEGKPVLLHSVNNEGYILSS